MLSTQLHSGTNLPENIQTFLNHQAEINWFYGYGWYHNFMATVSKPENAFMLTVETRDGDVCAVLPICKDEKGEWRALSNYYSVYFSPLFSESQPTEQVVDSLLEGLQKHLNHWSAIHLTPMALEESACRALLAGLQRNRLPYTPYFTCGNWRADVSGMSFSDYLAARPSKLRNTFKRREKKLKRDHRLEFNLICSEEGLSEAMVDYERIYEKSWKKSEPYPHFTPGLARAAAQDGTLRMGLLYVDGRIAAAQLWLVANDTAYIYKLAYDPDFASLSVGTVLTMYLAHHCIEVDCVKTIDYLTGDDAYKRDWMTERRDLCGVLIMNPRSIKGRLLAIKERLLYGLRRLRGQPKLEPQL